jgi:hypothetical protein
MSFPFGSPTNQAKREQESHIVSDGRINRGNNMFRIRHWLAQTFATFAFICLVAIIASPSEWFIGLGSSIFFWVLVLLVRPKL